MNGHTKMRHVFPNWVSDETRLFVTICEADRTRKSLAVVGVADALLAGLVHYEMLCKWDLQVAVIMPDHIHFIARFPRDADIGKTVGDWKRFQSQKLGVRFESGFFEHRIRNDDEFKEKCSYVLLNPVRKQLCENVEDWKWRYPR